MPTTSKTMTIELKIDGERYSLTTIRRAMIHGSGKLLVSYEGKNGKQSAEMNDQRCGPDLLASRVQCYLAGIKLSEKYSQRS